MRVITVQHYQTGKMLKVCESRDAFVQWLDRADWDRDDLKVNDCHVYEA